MVTIREHKNTELISETFNIFKFLNLGSEGA